MRANKSDKTPAPTIGEIPDEVWPLRQRILDEQYPPKPKGHRRVDLRRVLNGIIFRLRTGCQWKRLPKALGDDSTGPRHVQRWCHCGRFARLWAVLVEACADLEGVDWEWPAAATVMGNARMGGALVGRNPTDRGQKG
jgi:putative transposase